MITKEQIEIAFGNNRKAFKKKDVDHTFKAVALLRERVPYEVCRSIIVSAEHDVIYLCDLSDAIQHLSEEDLEVLADCNVFIEKEYGCFGIFV